jgi:head-tail adaptor
MKDTKKITLIDGRFTHDEAKEILSSMISSKINFHDMRNWSSQERFGSDDEISQMRIPQLRMEMEKLHALLSEARNKTLVIKADIEILILEE